MSITTDIQCYGKSMFEKYCIEAKKRADRNLHASSDIAVLYANQRIAELQAELAASNRAGVELVKAIQNHKDSFIGKEEDIVPEDADLWASLQEKGE